MDVLMLMEMKGSAKILKIMTSRPLFNDKTGTSQAE